MTRLYDDPARFSDDALDGFVDANASYVTAVPGGVVRSTETPPGKVAVVVGGGSGHYPAFCGLVGPGFADGAVVGNIFTSPSAEDAYSVGRNAANDAGLLFSTGNYAGDVLNFTIAQERLQGEGIDTRCVWVTDDVASAPADEVGRRRGIAGDFVVFRVAGAAAEAGYDLDGVERVAHLANDRTRTLGVAFDGCTMPGDSAPLFSVPTGTMGVGLGIHGEPGISEEPMPTASDLAARLVAGVLAEKPADASPRVGAILNGLGTTKYEELFIVWKTVSRLLREAGLEIVDPEVGELVTSLDMAGCSLTLVYLDDELESLWRAPADTPAYRKGAAITHAEATRPTTAPRRAAVAADMSSRPVAHAGSSASQTDAHTVLAALQAMSDALRTAEHELGRLDAVAGDGDHGRGMVKGVSAAVDAARSVVANHGGVAAALDAAGSAWADKAGGTSGVLWGAALRAGGASIGDAARSVGGPDLAAAVRAGLDTIQRLGKAELGDKTMLDSGFPFVDSLDAHLASGSKLVAAWAAAAEDAEVAAKATAGLRPKIGRARPLADRSVGTPDAGATSLALCLRVVGDVAQLAHDLGPEITANRGGSL
jgi:dihydroxyacetone kinase